MKKLIQILQLDHKWVRVMLGVSAIVILGILFVPNMGIMKQEMSREPIAYSIDKAVGDTLITDRNEPAPAPAEEEIVEEKEPFDWKETITWAIGAMNALVLVLLNVKNLLLKKST